LRSAEDYRLRTIADAYYTSDGNSDYVVLAGLEPKDFGIAVHEYVHHVLHSSGLKVPPCLNEGLAEFFSTLRIVPGMPGHPAEYQLGGDLPARSQTLQRKKWLPLAKLLELPVPETRQDAELFYAQSWALADMLVTSSEYSGHFRDLVFEFNSGTATGLSFYKAYGESLAQVEQQLKKWIERPRFAGVISNGGAEMALLHCTDLSAREEEALLARLLLVGGHLQQSQARYEEILREWPNDPDAQAALGTIALRQGKRAEALKEWHLAIGNNLTDADLCYRYALLAEESGVSEQDLKARSCV